jgi:hypothetical protein
MSAKGEKIYYVYQSKVHALIVDNCHRWDHVPEYLMVVSQPVFVEPVVV